MLMNRRFSEGIKATYFAIEVPSPHEDSTLLRRRVFGQSTRM